MSSHLNDPHQGIQKGKTKLNEINYQLKSLSPPRNSKLNKPGFDTPPANLSQYTRHRLQDAQNAIDDVKSIEEYLESPSRRVNLGKTTIQNIFEESSKNLANRLKSSSKNTNVNSLLSPPEFPIGASQLPRRKPPPPPPNTRKSISSPFSPRVDFSRKYTRHTNSLIDGLQAGKRLDQARNNYQDILASFNNSVAEDTRLQNIGNHNSVISEKDKASIMKEIDNQLDYEMNLHLDDEDSRRRHYFLKHHLEGKFPHLIKSSDSFSSVSPYFLPQFSTKENMNRIVSVPSNVVSGPMKILVIEEIQNLRSKLTAERKNNLALMRKLERLSDEKFRKKHKEVLRTRRKINEGDIQTEAY